jgi:hypothetical protein
MYAATGGLALYALQFLGDVPNPRTMYFSDGLSDKKYGETTASWFGVALAQNALLGTTYFSADADTKKSMLNIMSVNFGLAFAHYMYQTFSAKTQKIDYGAILFQLGMMGGAAYYARQ